MWTAAGRPVRFYVSEQAARRETKELCLRRKRPYTATSAAALHTRRMRAPCPRPSNVSRGARPAVSLLGSGQQLAAILPRARPAPGGRRVQGDCAAASACSAPIAAAPQRPILRLRTGDSPAERPLVRRLEQGPRPREGGASG
eukprot:scaffold1629_cov369-Prasinococcus_capsulatus_cf.AAC.21